LKSAFRWCEHFVDCQPRPSHASGVLGPPEHNVVAMCSV
jgi:hypothetical protein